jgi:hypothetical protein
MRLLGLGVVALLSSAGCGFKVQKSNEAASSTAIVVDARSTASSVGAASAVPSVDPARRLTFGIGLFIDNKIEACMDHDLTFDKAEDAKEMSDSLRKIADGAAARAQIFEDGCAVAFKDRVALGTCVEPFNGKAKGTSTTTHYMIESLQDDKVMRDCLKKKGKWTALPHDSSEYQQADAEARLRALNKQLGK